MKQNLDKETKDLKCTTERKESESTATYEIVCSEDENEVSKVDIITTPRSSAYYYHSFEFTNDNKFS